MDYKEKIKLSETAMSLINAKKSLGDVEEYLSTQNLYQYDINKVMLSVKKTLEDQFGNEIMQYLLDDNFEEKKSKFDFLHPDLVEFLKERKLEELNIQYNKKVKELILKGYSTRQLLEALKKPCYSEEKILEQIEIYKKGAASKRQVSENKQSKTVAIVFLALSAILFISRPVIVDISLSGSDSSGYANHVRSLNDAAQLAAAIDTIGVIFLILGIILLIRYYLKKKNRVKK